MDDNLQHEKELCGDIVPRLFEDDVWKDIDALDAEDTILVLRQAKDVIRKGLFDEFYNDTTSSKDVFEAGAARLGRELCRKLMALPDIYTLIDNSTMLPALDNRGGIFLFTRREFADAALDYHMQQLHIWQVREIGQKDIYPFLGNEFYDNGARYAVINDGQDWCLCRPEEFIDKPQYAHGEAPVSNPDYIRALTLLQQELHWRADYEGKQKTLHGYEDDMIRTFGGARFLVPFKTDARSDGISIKFEPGNQITYASLTNAEGRTALPIFSDWDQFMMVYDPHEWQGWVVGAGELSDLPAETVVVNPATIAFAMGKSFLGKMLSIYRSEFAPDKGPLSEKDYPGYILPAEGSTLREKIEELIKLAGETFGRPADISGLRKLYADENVPLLPAGEDFLKRYAYLFSTMGPSFENPDDAEQFYFDTFDEMPDLPADCSLNAAYGRDWRATGAAGCPVTPVGIYGFGEPYIVYAGENGRLYAFRGFNDEVRAYDSLEDLLEEALEGHMPVGLDD